MVVGESTLLHDFLVMFVNGVHAQHVVPDTWQYAVAAQLGKNNGKKGCAAVRLINLLDPVGKMFFSFLWGRSREERRHGSYGFYKGRRREQAILVQNVLTWKLRTLKAGYVIALHDVSNAFPSPSHDCLDETIRDVAHADNVLLLQYRYSNSRLRLDAGRQGTLLVAPGSGGMQGDTSMAQIFRTMFDRGVDEWDSDPHIAKTLLDATFDGIHYVGLSRTTFADDCAETLLSQSFIQVVGTLARSDAALDDMLERRGMGQNKGKKEVMFCFMGHGSVKESQKVWNEWDEINGKLQEKVKYLGNVRRWDGRETDNIRARCQAATIKFWEFTGLWKKRDVPLGTKRLVFHSVVVATLLSGLEAATLSEFDTDRLTKKMVQLGRKALGSLGSKTLADGSRRSISDREVMKLLRLVECANELRWRRLRWWRSVLWDPENNVQLLAALFGRTRLEEREGVHLVESPWLDQLMKDLTVGLYTINIWIDVRHEYEQRGWQYLTEGWWKYVLNNLRARRVREYKGRFRDVVRPVGEEWICGENVGGCPCMFVGNVCRMATHRRRAHGIINAYRTVVFEPRNVCGMWFKTVETAKHHVEKAFDKGRCPDRSRDVCKGRIIPNPVEYTKCKLCHVEVQGEDEIRFHMLQHMEAKVRGEG